MQFARGNHQLEIRRRGDGPLYWDVQLTVFSQEERIEAAGLETEIDRRYYRLIAEDGTDGIRGDADKSSTSERRSIAGNR